jgi:beta-N-acetylhexosaminidase
MGALLRLYGGPGVNASGAAAVAAVKAGIDMLILPSDLDGAYNGLLAAVRRGEIAPERIDESVLKILRAKASVGLHRGRLADPEALARVVGRPQSQRLAQQVADAAVTLVRDNHGLIPFPAGNPVNGTKVSADSYNRVAGTGRRVVAVVFTDDARNDSGRALERALRARVPDANVIYVDPGNAELQTASILSTIVHAERVVAAAYVVPRSGRKVLIDGEWKNSVSLAAAQAKLLEQMITQVGPRLAVIALGSPYLLADFPTMETYLCTFSDATVSETSAVRALFGEISIGGRLPVSIPGIASRGDGIPRRAKLSLPQTQSRRSLGTPLGAPHQPARLVGAAGTQR